MTRLAFLGLGRMGGPMAARIADAGHDLSVWNRTPRPAATPAGARVAASPADAVRGAEVIVTMLADGHALENVLGAEDGVLAAAGPGAHLIDMSTVGPELIRRLAEPATRAGVRVLDAPVSGSVPAAEAGTLTALIGGDPADVAAVQPTLAAMTNRQIHCGPLGAGATMKLAINLMLATTNEAIAELLGLAEAAGIAREVAYEALAHSAVASPYVGYKRAAFTSPTQAPTAFTVALMAKDVDLALELAGRRGAVMPVGEATAGTLAAAVAAGLGDADLSQVGRALTAPGASGEV